MEGNPSPVRGEGRRHRHAENAAGLGSRAKPETLVLLLVVT